MPRLLALIVLFPLIVFSQSQTVRGTVSDGSTGEPLPAANLQIEGTYRGTITNNYGEFLLEVESIPTTLIVSFIGYERKNIQLQRAPSEPLKIALTPVILETEPIVVTAEDPGMGIMRKVIERKRLWYDSLKTYSVEAYNRITLANDSAVVSVMETLTEKFWHHEKGPREVIKAKKQTVNVSRDNNFAFSVDFPNFYDDDVPIQGFDVVGPTHPDAFDYYEFKLIDRKGFDGDTVYVIGVRPVALLNPTFVGTVSVLDSVWALLAVDLKPNPETIVFPPPFERWDVAYKQQFNNFGREFWLPVDIRNDGEIKISLPGLEFPLIKYQRSSRLSDYRINIDLPDSLYEEDGRIVREDSLAIEADTVLAKRIDVIPLTREEEVAYSELDSTDTFEKAFKPSGMLTRFMDIEEDGSPDTTQGFFDWFTPDLAYNRVEEAHLGLTFEHTFFNRLDFSLNGHYITGLQRGGWQSELAWRLPVKKRSVAVAFEAGEHVKENWRSPNYYPLLVSGMYLLGLPDYYDYHINRFEKISLQLGQKSWMPELTVWLMNERQMSVSPQRLADFSLQFKERDPRINPAVQDAFLRSAGWSLELGGDYVPFGIAALSRLYIRGEHSLSALDSDYDYNMYHLEADWYIDTFLQRRIFPNRLNVRLVAGTQGGTTPPQKLGVLDPAYGAFSPFGVFRARRDVPYLGEKYAALFWEHNFRSVPFELIGWRWPVEKSIGVILHGGHGRSWLSDAKKATLSYGSAAVPEEWHHEVGLSVNGLFGFLRLDVTQRLDRQVTYLGLGLFRWF